MFMLAIDCVNFNATACITIEILAFEYFVITIMQDYARTVHPSTIIAICFVVHLVALNCMV
jgi:hypothetical protein